MSARKIPRFISITDFTAHSQVAEMDRVFRAAGGPALGLRLGIGVMTGRNLRAGKRTRHDKVFPTLAEIPKIFAPLPDERPDSIQRPFRVLHYIDHNRLDRQGALEHLIAAVAEAKPGIDALQLDMVWPDAADLARLREVHPDVPIILQVGRWAIHEFAEERRLSGPTPSDRLVARLARYQAPVPLFGAVLLDRSEGEGLLLNGKALAEEAVTIRTRFPHLGLVVAGGLGPDTLDALDPILEQVADVSIDAQLDLHFNRNLFYPVDWDRAAAFLRAGVEKFRTKPARRI